IRYDNAQYGFGSRVKMKNTRILRRGYRHLIGRVLTTLIDIRFQLGIYDTQCGAKIFDKSTAQFVFRDPFVSSWLFDVEVFLRLRNVDPVVSGLEIPLLEWHEKKGSKLNTLTAWKIMKELFKIYSSYK